MKCEWNHQIVEVGKFCPQCGVQITKLQKAQERNASEPIKELRSEEALLEDLKVKSKSLISLCKSLVNFFIILGVISVCAGFVLCVWPTTESSSSGFYGYSETTRYPFVTLGLTVGIVGVIQSIICVAIFRFLELQMKFKYLPYLKAD